MRPSQVLSRGFGPLRHRWLLSVSHLFVHGAELQLLTLMPSAPRPSAPGPPTKGARGQPHFSLQLPPRPHPPLLWAPFITKATGLSSNAKGVNSVGVGVCGGGGRGGDGTVIVTSKWQVKESCKPGFDTCATSGKWRKLPWASVFSSVKWEELDR